MLGEQRTIKSDPITPDDIDNFVAKLREAHRNPRFRLAPTAPETAERLDRIQRRNGLIPIDRMKLIREVTSTHTAADQFEIIRRFWKENLNLQLEWNEQRQVDDRDVYQLLNDTFALALLPRDVFQVIPETPNMRLPLMQPGGIQECDIASNSINDSLTNPTPTKGCFLGDRIVVGTNSDDVPGYFYKIHELGHLFSCLCFPDLVQEIATTYPVNPQRVRLMSGKTKLPMEGRQNLALTWQPPTE